MRQFKKSTYFSSGIKKRLKNEQNKGSFRGKSYNMVNAYVQNRQQPRLEILMRIAEILDIDVKDIIISNLEKKNLIESPFTMIHPEGIRGVFSPKEINEILQFTDKVLAA